MKQTAAALCCIILLASCGGSPDAGDDARLRVTQHQLACCFMEGQVSYVQLVNDRGESMVEMSVRPLDMVFPLFDETLPPGRYTLRTWQRPCAGNCSLLDPPRNECETVLELAPGAEVFVTSAFTPGEECSHTETAGPLPSPIPDSFAFRETLRSCGEELPFAGPAPGRSPVRTCFYEAWAGGGRAEASLWTRVSERAVRPRYHRILPDRRIEVFAAPENPGNGDAWTYYYCAGIVAVEDIRVFTLEGCSDPEILAQ